MIVIEDYRTREDGVVLKRTYSNKGKYIIQKKTGAKYAEAIDVKGKNSYTESEEDIPKETEEDVQG